MGVRIFSMCESEIGENTDAKSHHYRIVTISSWSHMVPHIINKKNVLSLDEIGTPTLYLAIVWIPGHARFTRKYDLHNSHDPTMDIPFWTIVHRERETTAGSLTTQLFLPLTHRYNADDDFCGSIVYSLLFFLGSNDSSRTAPV